jgi:uncharacterized membrane protein YbaN (DUF454 family)
VERSEASAASNPGPGPEAREHRSAWVRWLFIAAGSVCVALGLVGLFLPLLPTTPFLLLAAACYARGSRRFYDWLLANRTFGPLIHEWRTHRSIPYRTKISAIGLMSATLGVSILFFVQPLWLKGLLAAMGVGLAVWMYRMPSRDRPSGPRLG